MKFLYICLAVVLLSFLVLAGCQRAPAATTPAITTSPTPAQTSYTDDLGRNINIVGTPQRIVSLTPSNTEILFALGLGDRVVGVTSYDNYPAEASQKAIIGGFSDPDIEKIASLSPDLILADSILHKVTIIPALEKLGLTVAAITPGTLEQVISDIQMVGKITGQINQADNLTNSMQKRIAAITDKTGKITNIEKLRVFYLTWYDPLWTAGGNTMMSELIEKAGGVNIAADLIDYATITLETLIERNPQIILVMSSMGDQDTSFNYVKSEARLQAVDALKNNFVYKIDADIFGRTTPRIVDGIEQIAGIIHPEIFK